MFRSSDRNLPTFSMVQESRFIPNAPCGMVHITRTESSDLWAVVLPCNLELFFSMQERIMWPACNTDVHRVAQTREACCSGNTNSAIAGQSGSRTTRKQVEGLDVLWKRKAQNPTVTRDRAEPDSSPQQRRSLGGRLVYMRLTVAPEFPEIHGYSAGRYSTLPRSANMTVGEKYRQVFLAVGFRQSLGIGQRCDVVTNTPPACLKSVDSLLWECGRHENSWSLSMHQ